MHWITELLSGWGIRIVRPKIDVLRLMAISSPMTFVLAGLGVVHDHAMVAIAIGDIDFIGVLVDKDLRGQPQVLDVVTASARAGLSDLHQELSLLSELHDHAVVKVSLRTTCLHFRGGRTLGRLPAAVASDPH